MVPVPLTRHRGGVTCSTVEGGLVTGMAGGGWMNQGQLHHYTTYRRLHGRTSPQQLDVGFITLGTPIPFQSFLSLNNVNTHFIPPSGTKPSKLDGTAAPHRHTLK